MGCTCIGCCGKSQLINDCVGNWSLTVGQLRANSFKKNKNGEEREKKKKKTKRKMMVIKKKL